MRLIIFPGNFVPHIGGLETHVDEFSKELSIDDNYSIVIVTPKVIVNSKIFEVIHNNVKVYRYPSFELIPNFPVPKLWSFNFWKIFMMLYREDFELVMTRTRFFSNTFIGYIFAKWRIKKLKLIHVEHGSSFVLLSSKIKSLVAKIYDLTFGRLIFRSSDQVIAISETVKKFILENFINSNIPVIRRGVDIESINSVYADSIIDSNYGDKIKFLYVGRLFKWKGVENSIKAFMSLPLELKKRVVFLIVGYGEDLENLKDLASNEDNIVFLGKKSFKESISIMKSSDYFIHSAYPGGGLSSSLMQAMVCSCTPIASPNEGANEIINNNNGFLLDNNGVDELRRGMEYVLNNNFKGVFSEDFSWDKSIMRYKEVLKKCVG